MDFNEGNSDVLVCTTILEEAVRELKDEHFKELFADAQEGSSALARGSRRDQSDDCIIETDLTMLIPNSNERDGRAPRALPQARRHRTRVSSSASPTRSPIRRTADRSRTK